MYKKHEPLIHAESQLAFNFEVKAHETSNSAAQLIYADFRPQKTEKKSRQNSILERLREHAAHLTW